MTYKVKTSSIRQQIAAISGVFINSGNPSGLTLAEQDFIAKIIDELGSTIVLHKEVKVALANAMNMKLQVVVNYINKLKRKGAISVDNRLHFIFSSNEVIVKRYGKDTM